MTTLISDADKSAISAVFDDIHDTFARDIVIYKMEQSIAISSNLDANPIYDRSSDSANTKPRTVAYTGRARILYQGNQAGNNGLMNGDGGRSVDGSFGLATPNGSIRLKVDATAYALIKAAQKIEIDGKLCEVISDSARPGPFTPVYYTIFLKLVV